MAEPLWDGDAMMTVAASRALHNGEVCFVGIGLPSAAANLARRTHAPDVVLIYESGTIATRPQYLPLSIGDGELAETADTVVSVPEMFRYWLQGGRIDVGFLGAAQIDRFGNLNTTVIGPYDAPRVRLPGAGGAPEIAALAKKILIVARHDSRVFVERLDFITTAGFLGGGDERARRGISGAGPQAIITDLGILTPEPGSNEFILSALHPGVSEAEVRTKTGWRLRSAKEVATTLPPTAEELTTLRALKQPRPAAPRKGVAQ